MLDALWSEAETAREVRKTTATLRTWRSRRRGPPYVKVGAYVFYEPAKVKAWLKAQTREINPAEASA